MGNLIGQVCRSNLPDLWIPVTTRLPIEIVCFSYVCGKDKQKYSSLRQVGNKSPPVILITNLPIQMKSVPLIVRVNLISMQAGAVFLSTINI